MQRAPDRTPPRPHSFRLGSALRWGEAVLAVLVIAGLIWLIVLRQQNATLQNQLTVATDSLAMARQRDSLLSEVLDLETELHARQAGIIAPEISPVQSPHPGSSIPTDVQPVPDFVSTEIDPVQKRRARDELVGDSAQAFHDLRVVYTQSDVESTGAATLLRGSGLAVSDSGEVQSKKSTAVTMGPGVPDAAGRRVVLALMASGIDIKRLRRSAHPSLANTISITYARPLLDWPGLTVDQILRMSSARTPTADAVPP